jgi:hypothetical protein
MSPQTASEPTTLVTRAALTALMGYTCPDRPHTSIAPPAADLAAIEREAQALVLDALEAAVLALPPVINSAPWHYIDRAAVLEAIQQQRSKP